MHTFISRDQEKHWTIALKDAGVSLRQFENQPKVAFSNFTLRRHEDIDHWMFSHLKHVRHICRSSLNHFWWINIVPCDIVVDVNVKVDTRIAWQIQISGWLLLRQNVGIVDLSSTRDYLIPPLP